MSKLDKQSKNTALAADKAVFERVYAHQGAGWTLEQPPAELTKLYYSSARELRDLFASRFRIVETKSTTIHGRLGQSHAAHLFLRRFSRRFQSSLGT